MTNNALEIGSRNMVDAVFESVHPFHKAMFLSEEKFTKNPSFFVAEASDGSYQAHTFHHHPFAMRVPEMISFVPRSMGLLINIFCLSCLMIHTVYILRKIVMSVHLQL